MKILMTGGAGSLGRAMHWRLLQAGHSVLSTDLVAAPKPLGPEKLDVRDDDSVWGLVAWVRPEVILHLAGAKSAPAGESDPEEALETNALGTLNVVRAAKGVGARVISASTCKAADPETVYGATKLIAERITLNAGGSVARFYNIVDSSGNVFELWKRLGCGFGYEPVPVTPCSRYFITMFEAATFLLRVIDLPPGRYAPDPGQPIDMWKIAEALYPAMEKTLVPPRRGDRIAEPRHADHETLETVECGIHRILSRHDAS